MLVLVARPALPIDLEVALSAKHGRHVRFARYAAGASLTSPSWRCPPWSERRYRRGTSEKNRQIASSASNVWLCGPLAGQSITPSRGTPPGQL